jgi:DNA-binding transcriptional ArsR family regulator
MQCLLLDWYEEPWKQEAVNRLGLSFKAELAEVFEPYRNGANLFETVIGWELHKDVAAFIARLRNCSTEEFSHYIFGRIAPPGNTLTDFNPAELRALFEHYGEYAHYLETISRLIEEGENWPAKLADLKRRFADLVERFWVDFFRERIEQLRSSWTASVHTNRAYAQEHGPLELLALLTEQRKLPPMVPTDEPLRRIDFVPLAHLPTTSIKYTAHGSLTCLYKADRTEEQIARLRQTEQETIRLAKALGDGTRMQIMRLIFQHPHTLNGQNIAELTGLAKSVVSKHLRQLIDAGLVIEETRDRRNNMYTVNSAAIRRLSGQLLKVLRG